MTVERDTLYYCPDCGRRDETGGKLCVTCGGTLIERGYCPTCEAYVLQPVGGFCHKHDVELLHPDEIEEHSHEDVSGVELVTIKAFGSSSEADAARIRLEAEGIPTFLDAARMGSGSFYSVATGGVKIRVPKSLEADARVVLSQNWTPVDPGEQELEDAWDEMRPQPWERRRDVMRVFILILVFGPTLLALLTALVFKLFA